MSIADANRKYFDQISDSYDDKPWFAKANKQVTEALRARLDRVGIPFANTGASADSQQVSQLDYACGTGLLSRIYGPYVTITRGIDVSPKMVANFNSRAQAAGLSESTIHAVLGDLLDKANPTPAEVSGPEWQNFDLVTVGYAFHHFEDVVHAAERLKERLRPGGVMVITDFLEGGDLKADENGDPIPGTEGNHFTHHHHHHGHDHGEETQHHENHHHGHDNKEDVDSPTRDASIVTPHFTLENVKKFLIKAGFVDVDAVSMGERVYMVFGGHQLWRTVLFAKGRRPVEEKPEL